MYGKLGGGFASSDYSVDQVAVKDLSGVTEIATGMYSTCALLSGGKIMCWGENRDGQLGAGLADDRSLVPVPVAGW